MSKYHSDRGFIGLVIILLAYMLLIYYTIWILIDIVVSYWCIDC
jgi:cell division protein FtsW (lipid II flippase)